MKSQAFQDAQSEDDLFRVTIKSLSENTARIRAVELTSTGPPLPVAPAGAHIDVHLPNGLVRHYSVIDQSDDRTTYRIGVLLAPDSRGGSRWIHETAKVGDDMFVSLPTSRFVMKEDAERAILLGGGIGIAPLLSMATALRAADLAFELHYFAQSFEDLAFVDWLEELGEMVTPHLGHGPDETVARLDRILSQPVSSGQVYACGPGPFLAAIDRLSKRAGWLPERIHFEYFNADPRSIESGRFTIDLARSGLTLEVAKGQSILDVFFDNDVYVDTSCEEGVCGSCVVGVLDGIPLHRDVCLSEEDRERGDKMTVCVSRSISPLLVLDI